jgi:hypothetical protein
MAVCQVHGCTTLCIPQAENAWEQWNEHHSPWKFLTLGQL